MAYFGVIFFANLGGGGGQNYFQQRFFCDFLESLSREPRKSRLSHFFVFLIFLGLGSVGLLPGHNAKVATFAMNGQN